MRNTLDVSHNKIEVLTSGRQMDYSISFIRLISFLLIITCHIQQYLNIVLAWWFNVGVQIFLCISGYLYGMCGGVEIADDVMFYKKRIRKILIPYYAVVIPVIIIQWIFFSEEIGAAKIIHVLLCRDTLSGGGHLWFIPTILICYILTPYLGRYLRSMSEDHILIRAIKIICIYAVVFDQFFGFFNSAWIVCYSIGFVLGFFVKKQLVKYGLIIKVSVGILCLLNVVQIIIDYVYKLQFTGTIEHLYSDWCSYNHVWLGITVFNVLKYLFDKIDFSKHKRLVNILKISDEYSYEGYLVHLFIILGPMSLMALTKYVVLNVAVILLLTVIFSVLLKKVVYVFNGISH